MEDALWLNLTLENSYYDTANGLNGYPNVDGSAFYYNSSFYAFASSHSFLLNMWNKRRYETMLIWTSAYYDDKGVTNKFTDSNEGILH